MYQRKNFAYTTVATAPSPASSGTTLVVASGEGARFPNTSGGTYVCVIKAAGVPATPDNAEVVLVTSHDPANDNFTITRTQESSDARTVVVGDEFYLSPTDGVWDQIDVLTTKGDLLTFSTVYARLGVGTDGQILESRASETTGLKWITPAYAPSASPTFTGTVVLPKTVEIQDTSADHQYTLAVSELTADRAVTLPLLVADDTFVFRNHNNIAIKFNYPRGYLVNGKIVPSVASNNLTVAIKGLDGNDPSATNPVYCRIGDTIQAITSALSVTKNAATNWFGCGSTGMATYEVDYFVYLGYNATDGVVIGFSRIPMASTYGGFSATSTDPKYCAISTITNAASTDIYENIGRFAATLSAGTGYTWTVPTFTGLNLIQKPIFETRGLTWSPVVTGWSSETSKSASYKIVGSLIHYAYDLKGTSNSTSFGYSSPFSISGYIIDGWITDNGGFQAYPALLEASGLNVNVFRSPALTAYTNSGEKRIIGNIVTNY